MPTLDLPVSAVAEMRCATDEIGQADFIELHKVRFGPLTSAIHCNW
ncbi:hypothetical protein [Nocardia sp. NPDC051570]